MLGSDADRFRWYGSTEGVAAVDAYLDALVAVAPPLTVEQKARLRTLLRPSVPVTTPPSGSPVPVRVIPETRAA